MREDLNTRRSRLGSQPSAADSGADLTLSCDSNLPYKDADGDIDMVSLEESPRDPLKLLPSEVCLQIFELLDAADLAKVELVSKDWRRMTSQQSVWRTAFLRKYERPNPHHALLPSKWVVSDAEDLIDRIRSGRRCSKRVMHSKRTG